MTLSESRETGPLSWLLMELESNLLLPINLYIFIINQIVYIREEEVDLLKNSQHLLPYKSVANSLENDVVRLL